MIVDWTIPPVTRGVKILWGLLLLETLFTPAGPTGPIESASYFVSLLVFPYLLVRAFHGAVGIIARLRGRSTSE